MSRNRLWLTALVILFVGILMSNKLVWPQEGTTQVHWEYKVVEIRDYRNFKLIESTLNEYGNDGWEVIDWEVDERDNVFLLKR